MTAEVDLRRAWLALIAAELSGDQESAALILRRAEEPEFAFEVAVYAAHLLATATVAVGDQYAGEMRSNLGAELHRLAGVDEV